MKKQLLFLCLMMGILFASYTCDDNNGYSLGDFRINIATVEVENEGVFSLVLDNGTTLWPVATAIHYVPENGQRVFVNYTILSDEVNNFDFAIKINDIWDILTKNPIVLKVENADSIGNDPVEVNKMWIGNDYLNVDFLFNYGGIRPHAINLVENSIDPSPEDGKVHLEFRHNSFNSPSNHKYNGFVCFNLESLRTNNADSVVLSVKVNEWDGTRTYDLTYRFNDIPQLNVENGTTVPVISSNEYY